MSRPGWLKLYHQTLDSDFWIDPAPFSHRDAFLHVLMAANWRPGKTRRNGHVYEIKRGQLLTSLRNLQKVFHWGSTDRVSRWIRLMENYGMIEHENVGFGTLLTVVNYDKYQNGADTPKDTLEDTLEDTVKDTPKDRVAVRSKNIDYRQQTTDNILPSQVPAPDGASPVPPDDDDDDDEFLPPKEAQAKWESTHSDQMTPGTSSGS